MQSTHVGDLTYFIGLMLCDKAYLLSVSHPDIRVYITALFNRKILFIYLFFPVPSVPKLATRWRARPPVTPVTPGIVTCLAYMPISFATSVGK